MMHRHIVLHDYVCVCCGLKSTVPVDKCQDLGLSVINSWYQIDFMELDVLPNVPTKWESILE